MQIALASLTRKVIFMGGCLAITVASVGLSVRAFLADHYSQKLDLASLQLAARLEPGNAEYQYRIGQYFLQTQDSPSVAGSFLRSAVSLNPHNATYWFALSRMYQRLANLSEQKDALQHAIAVDPSTPGVAWEAANFYWSMGETDKALREFRVDLANDYLPTETLDRCWRIKPDVNALLRDVVPARADVYSEFLDFLVARNEEKAAAVVWAQMVRLRESVEMRHVFTYVQYLIEHRKAAEAHQAWRDAAALCNLRAYQTSPANLVVNGDFSEPVLNGGFDWQYDKLTDVSLALDPVESHSGHRSLAIVFDSRGLEDAGIRQTVAVEPNTKYEFSAYFKAENLEGAGGPRFLLQDQYTAANYFASDELKDSDFWKQVGGTFTTGPQTKLLLLRVQRVPPGDAIRGKLWIDGVRLTQGTPEQDDSAEVGQ
jgi:tetratricopeptide (TPR) repeat protein